MTEKISGAKDREGLRSIVESLVETTNEMQVTNTSLEQKLTASKQEINQLQTNLETVRVESLTDPMTKLANRKFFDDTLDNAVADAHTRGEPLSLLMVDIDHFKTFNDTYGHLTGDQVLRPVATSLKQNVKGQDIAARYGGEEFAVILPNTSLQSAITVADHIRRAVMSKEMMKRSTGEHLGRVTVSVGAATLRRATPRKASSGARTPAYMRPAQRPQSRDLRNRSRNAGRQSVESRLTRSTRRRSNHYV
jgi:diguanylate cyclase